MIPYVFAALALFVAQTLLPPTLRYVAGGPGALARLRVALGPRDEQPAPTAWFGRAQRALTNMQEALPVFLTIALLHVARGTSTSTAEAGAVAFLVARSLYVVVYVLGIPVVRSALWVGSWGGLAAMMSAL